MNDNRITKLAELVLNHSVQIKEGETLYIEWKGNYTTEFVEELIRQTVLRGATPFWVFHDDKLLRAAVEKASSAQMIQYAKLHTQLMDSSQCYVAINGSDNPFEMSTVPSKQGDMFAKLFAKPVHLDRRIKNTRWCVLRWPSLAMAQLAGMPHKEFTDFYFDTCLVDYKEMSKKMDPIAKLMAKTDKVRIVAPDTDLTFSIKNIPVVKCDGHLNIPDGEIYTAPVADSINGTIKFNSPALYRGAIFTNIKMTFKNGLAEKITCDGDDRGLNNIFSLDEGTRRCGEFAVGLNPKITRPMKDSLFDEKIDGSIHMAMGQCYENAENGNRSAIHWDLVLIQTPAYGGGELYFDGKLIRKDGKFLNL